MWSALAYDACGMLLWAIEQVGADRTAIRDHLARCTTKGRGYTGVTGLTYFDAEGDCPSKPAMFVEVKDGRFVPAKRQLPR